MAIMLSAPAARAQEGAGLGAYFVTYSHQMEARGDMEIGIRTVSGFPHFRAAPGLPASSAGNAFVGTSLEFEYGVRSWWTTEIYLDGQATANENATFAGWRWENRVRPLRREHWVNPVLYAEFEDINGSNRSLLGIVGHDGVDNFKTRADRAERKRELELRMILSSDFKGWNVAENFVAERNFSGRGADGSSWEFGYAVGASRPVASKGKAANFSLGAEAYGGLGDTDSLTLRQTAHYIAPTVDFKMPHGPRFSVSPGFGLNDHSNGMLLRVGVWYEIEDVFTRKR